MRHQHPLLMWIAGISLLLASLAGAVSTGRDRGWLWGVGHFVLFWLSLVALLALLFLSLLVHEWLRRGGPRCPPCHNGTCKGRRWVSFVEKDLGDYRRTVVDGRTVLRCRCGGDYVEDLVGGRFLQRLPDDTLKPYMVHRPFGGWVEDTEADSEVRG